MHYSELRRYVEAHSSLCFTEQCSMLFQKLGVALRQSIIIIAVAFSEIEMLKRYNPACKRESISRTRTTSFISSVKINEYFSAFLSSTQLRYQDKGKQSRDRQ